MISFYLCITTIALCFTERPDHTAQFSEQFLCLFKQLIAFDKPHGDIREYFCVFPLPPPNDTYLRRANLVFSKEKVRIIDFDYYGKESYPENFNHALNDVKRHPNALPYEKLNVSSLFQAMLVRLVDCVSFLLFFLLHTHLTSPS